MLDLSNKTFLKTLRMLRIIARRFFRGQKMGGRKTQRRGASVEFSDYKQYNPGDDIRFIDWNIYGRLDRLLVKLFYNEENLSSYVFLDCSNSMNFGEPSKFDYARRLAAAIAYIAASNNDSVRIFCFGDGLQDYSPSADRAARIMALFRFLEARNAGGRSDLDSAVKAFIARFKRPGVIFILSDFLFDPPGGGGNVELFGDDATETGGKPSDVRTGSVTGAVKRLVYQKHDVNLIHLMAPEEVDPPYSGLWEFTDSETGRLKKIFIDSDVLSAYREAVEEHCRHISGFAAANRLHYLRTVTDVPFENQVLRLFSTSRQG